MFLMIFLPVFLSKIVGYFASRDRVQEFSYSLAEGEEYVFESRVHSAVL